MKASTLNWVWIVLGSITFIMAILTLIAQIINPKIDVTAVVWIIFGSSVALVIISCIRVGEE